MRIDRVLALSGLLACLGCAQQPDPDNPPQAHAGTCSHYQSATRVEENVPNCLMRNQTTLINGLPPAYPGNKS